MNPWNYTTIFFPLFGLELDPPRTISLGPLTLHFYGIIIATGLVLAVLYCCRRCPEFGIEADTLTDGVLYVTPFALICARIYYCVFAWDEFAGDPISVLYIWQGGIAIYGGVLGAVLGAAVFCRWRKISYPAALDLVSLGLLIGQAMGRWGNFFNREAFGAATELPWRMGLFNQVTGAYEYYHPTFLYESLWNIAGFVLLHFLSKRRKYDGQIALGYVAWYGLGRAFIEGLRMDSLYWGPFRVSQVLAAVSCLAATAVLLYQAFRAHDPERMFVRRVARANAEKAAAEAAEEETAKEPTEEVAEELAEQAAEEPTEEVADASTEAAPEGDAPGPEEDPPSGRD